MEICKDEKGMSAIRSLIPCPGDIYTEIHINIAAALFRVPETYRAMADFTIRISNLVEKLDLIATQKHGCS